MNAAHPTRRSAPLPLAIALAFGAGLLAMAGFVGLSSEAAPPRDEPASVDDGADVEAIAAEIAALRERNANALADLERASAELDAAHEAAPTDTAPSEPEPAATTPKKPSPKKPSPKKPSPKKPSPKKPSPEKPSTSTHRPIEIDDSRGPLDGIR